MAVPLAVFLLGLVLVALPIRRPEQEPHAIAEVGAHRSNVGGVSNNSHGEEPQKPTRQRGTVSELQSGYGVSESAFFTALSTRHAFISYVHEDSPKVDKLQQILEDAGIPVWRDTSQLWPGEDWRMKIRRAITDDAIVFIACFSRASLAREKSYQNEELTLAIEQLRLRRPDNPWLIPLRFDDCEIPNIDIGGGRSLASIQRADLSGNNFAIGAERVITAVLRIIGQYVPPRGAAVTSSPKGRSGRVVLSPEAIKNLDNIDPSARARILHELERISQPGSDAHVLRGRDVEIPYLVTYSAGYRIIFRRSISADRHSDELLVARIIKRGTAGQAYSAVRTHWRLSMIIAAISVAVVSTFIVTIVVPGTYISNPPRHTPPPHLQSPTTPPSTAGPAAASSPGNYSDCTARHCYSIAVSPSSMSGSPYQGARATMYLTRMQSGNASPSNPAHINSSLWVIQNSAHDAFMEEGIYDGWVGASNTRTCTRIRLRSHCTHFIYERGSGGSTKCVSKGCTAYIIYWAETNMSGATENTYFHVVEFTSPSPGTQLYVDDGYNFGEWKIHIMWAGLDYKGSGTLNSRYQYVQSIKVGGELDQVAKAGACADIESMEFAMWIPLETYQAFDAQAPTTALVDTSTFNGTQQVPGINNGTWLWGVPTTSNSNGC